VILRILCLSDGEDVGSPEDPVDVANFLKINNVVIDSFIVGPSSDVLKAITKSTGGNVYMPSNMKDGVRLFENETVLSAGMREQSYDTSRIASENELLNYSSRNLDVSAPSMR
jgi:hypothetical protein